MAREHNHQRKLQRKAKKAAKRRQRSRQEAAKTTLPLGAARGLDEAEEFLADGEYDQAIEVLEELARRYPRRVEILAGLADAQLQANDMWSYQATCERLTAVNPNEPIAWLALGSTALGNIQLATAERAFAHLVAHWPDHPESAQAREMWISLQELLVAECRRLGLDEKVGSRVLLLHDEVNLQLNRGMFDKVCDAATRLLNLCPTFAPALNNRSEANFRSARFAEAIADSRRVLEFNATNYHALANLTRHLYLSGQFDEAQTAAVALKACDANDGDVFLKKAETFAILGDWDAVRQAVQAGQSAWAKLGGTPSIADHLAGVALENLGDVKTAQKHWRRAAKAVEWANENLKDSKQAPGKRHGPWAFPLEYWAQHGVLERLGEAIAGMHHASDKARLVERHFERYPQLELLADAILERSDPSACEMLIRLAPLVNRPKILAALERFALGQRGTDELRMQALMTLSQAEYLEGQVEMWRNGELHPVMLVSQEIYCEPTVELPPEVNDLMFSAQEAIRDGLGAEAERLLDKVLRLRPDDASARFNRAVAIGLQGREGEALELVRQLHRDQPDYLFARTHLADNFIAEGNLEEAKTLLAPISKKRRLHTSEHAAWCSSNINLALALGDHKMARSMLHAREQVDPDDPRIKIWKDRIRGERGLLGRISRFLRQAQDEAK